MITILIGNVKFALKLWILFVVKECDLRASEDLS